MNAAQIHLALNHLPLAFTGIGAALLVLALAWKSRELRQVAAGLIVVGALCTVPVFLSGEPAEEIVEDLQGVSHQDIHEHEEAGELVLILTAILGVATLAVLLFERWKQPAPRLVWMGVFILAVLVLAFFIRTAHLGGLVRHHELQMSDPSN